MIKPFLKWVGGKKQLIKEINNRLPEDYTERIHVEPFIGGGSVLLYLQPDRAFISDYNDVLVWSYFAIAFSHKDVYNLLMTYKNTKEEYYKLRERFNKRKELDLRDIETTALFIYLNKTGFNGMYRVNSKGELNVPWNHNPHEDMSHFVKYQDLKDTSRYLFEHVSISTGGTSYHKIWEKFKEKKYPLFFYLDPPYAPLDKDIERGNFTEYTTYPGWDHDEQIRLCEVCKEIDKAGHKFMLSNSSCTLIKDLYKDFKIEEVDARRMISAKKETRGGCKEVIVTNY